MLSLSELPHIVLMSIARNLSLADLVHLRSCARALRRRLSIADRRLHGLSLIFAELERIFILPSTLQQYDDIEKTYDALQGFLSNLSYKRTPLGCEVLFEEYDDIEIDVGYRFLERYWRSTVRVMDFIDPSKSVYLTGVSRLSWSSAGQERLAYEDCAIYMHIADGQYALVYQGTEGSFPGEARSALPTVAKQLHTTHKELAKVLGRALSAFAESSIHTGTGVGQHLNWSEMQPKVLEEPEDFVIEYDLQRKRLTAHLLKGLEELRPRLDDTHSRLWNWIRSQVDLKKAESHIFFFRGIFRALHDNWCLFHDTNLAQDTRSEAFAFDWVKNNIVFTSFSCNKIAPTKTWPHPVEKLEVTFTVNGSKNPVTFQRLLCCPDRNGGWNELVCWSDQIRCHLFEAVAKTTSLTLVIGAHSLAFRDIAGCSETWRNADVFMLVIAAVALSFVAWPPTPFELRRVYVEGENETLLEIPLEPPLRVQPISPTTRNLSTVD
ncbi:uncharacterized protein SPPG_03444 [Spizellomyces punctatus DAOM BR117]|uniref:F-box domain-containing protein n=1 Tax=Spizellomyces punctatus (strain DAOM BR117) TaxID=645134 RepID=A0A0L0HKM5_SPIPD|nr:uncharacterized protein SPPG_03444 [Spizellomyces punctatus DAOM BR117]KND01647.1 hypothetical protein SPPG_03444 [Spizellomyces punctatus DAOM BR117]|eukprot:XP_016609686.1 hypothetical protein SPPG_03444 [Spizellomyces punctatus DAOM BR117]